MWRLDKLIQHACWLILTGATAYAQGPVALDLEVQAILDRNCVKCHGPLEQKAGLRLDSTVSVWKGSEDGPVVVAGDPEVSKLVQVLAADAEPHMPPKKQLAESDVTVVRNWVATAA